MLPIARRDVERLQQILVVQPRLLDLRRRRARSAACSTAPSLDEAITWLEIHGDRPDVVAHWRSAAGARRQRQRRSRRDDAVPRSPRRGAAVAAPPAADGAARRSVRRAAGAEGLPLRSTVLQ